MERKDKNGNILKTGEYQRPDGLYQFTKMKNKKRYILYSNTLSSLREKESALLAIIAMQSPKNSTLDLSLNDYVQYWFETYGRQGRKPSTLQLYKNTYDYYLRSKIGSIPLKDLKRYDLQLIFNNLMDKGLKPGTLGVVRHCINNILETAVSEEIIYRNPLKGMILPKENKKHRTALGKEQLNAFLEFLRNDSFYSFYEPFFLTLFFTGMRVGECCALTWEDIDFESRLISVNKSQLRLNNNIYVGSPKSKSSFRKIPMNDIVYSSLLGLLRKTHEISENEKTDRKEFVKSQSLIYINDTGRECGTVSGFLFFSTRHRILTESTVRQIICHISKKSGNGVSVERFVPHQSRHTFTSMAYEAGIDVKYTSLILGHSSINTTIDEYTHLSEEFSVNQSNVLRKLGSR